MKRFVIILTTGLVPAVASAASGDVDVMPDNFGLQIWVILTFLVMFFLLAKLAFKPIGEALDRRSQAMKEALDEAEKSRAEAKQSLDQYQQQLAEARTEAKQIIEEAKALGENVRKEVVDKAQAEAQALMQRNQEELQRAKDKSLQELRETVAGLSVQIAGKVIEKQIDETAHRQLIENLINDLSKNRQA